MIWFRYDGEAVGKGRPRYARRGGYVQTYTPKKTKDFEEAIRMELMRSLPKDAQLPVYDRDKTLKMDVLVGVSIPKSYTKKKQALCRDRFIAPGKKPDIDNVCKAIMDACNGIAYEDDAQVVYIIAEKVYAIEPFVEVQINEHK